MATRSVLLIDRQEVGFSIWTKVNRQNLATKEAKTKCDFIC